MIVKGRHRINVEVMDTITNEDLDKLIVRLKQLNDSFEFRK